MPICESCNEKFDVDKARAKYDKKFGGDPSYDDMTEYCASCAINLTEEGLIEGADLIEMSPWLMD